MAAEAIEWQPLFLDVDPVYGICFALYCERHQIQLPSLRFIITSYEYPSVVHRRILERVFQVPVFNLYGSTETGHLLMEDEQGQMKPSFETALLEVIEPDAQAIGELVVTTLTNDYMPLVRYRIGDLVERRYEPYCTQYILHGRAGDAIINGAGQRVTVLQVDECFTGQEGLVHYQLRRSPEDNFELWYIPASTQSAPLNLEPAQTRLTDLLKPQHTIRFQAVDMLLSESSGKFRLVVQ
jgi:phenylacetate-CoA ligase